MMWQHALYPCLIVCNCTNLRHYGCLYHRYTFHAYLKWRTICILISLGWVCLKGMASWPFGTSASQVGDGIGTLHIPSATCHVNVGFPPLLPHNTPQMQPPPHFPSHSERMLA